MQDKLALTPSNSNAISFSKLEMNSLLILSLEFLIVLFLAFAYEDEELECKLGHAVASIRRNSAMENGPFSGTCRPMISGVSRLQDSRCKRLAPLQCTNSFETDACPDNHWLGGIIAYQLNTTRASLLAPICCASSHVQIINDSCEIVRITEFLQAVKYRVPSGEVITRLKCHYIADKGNNALDITLHVEICRYKID